MLPAYRTFLWYHFAYFGGKGMHNPLFVQWNDRNDTGIELIDEQHKGIVSIINTFFYMTSHGKSNHMLYSCISDTLKNYSRIHFITEEAFLAESGYKDLENHKKLHRRLVIEMEHVEYQSIRDNDARPLMNFLKKWWIEHINDEDQLYAHHLCTYLGDVE